jgi:hypothetical protein
MERCSLKNELGGAREMATRMLHQVQPRIGYAFTNGFVMKLLEMYPPHTPDGFEIFKEVQIRSPDGVHSCVIVDGLGDYQIVKYTGSVNWDIPNFASLRR